MHKYDLNEIYNDFFGTGALADNKKEEKTNISEEEILNSINELYLDEESKNTLIKIVNYIINYKEGIDKYLTFNIIVKSDNKEQTSKIINILSNLSKIKKYTDGSVVNSSLYNLKDISDLKKIYNNGIVSLYDLDYIEREEEKYKKQFLFSLFENLSDKKITILSGEKNIVNNFIYNDSNITQKYFKYVLTVIDPTPNEVYEEIKFKINNNIFNDKIKVDLLDYISNTINKKDVDYLTYRDNLIDYIAFNKELPELNVVKSIDEIFKELNELVGLKEIKEKLHELVDLISLKDKTKDYLKINNINLHMVFLGNPGTGKTTVARLIAGILYNLNYIKHNKLIEVSSKDLVAEYVGQTAPKTMEVINKAMGGVLFIDEAYALSTKGNENSYNAEAIATLIKAMEDYRDNLVIIFAGYTKEMSDFLDSNSGIVSRIGYTFDFKDYTNEELIEIFKQMMNKSGFVVEGTVINKLDEIINQNRSIKNFGNARFIRNVYEKTVLKHASNTSNKLKNKKVLKTITLEDINY